MKNRNPETMARMEKLLASAKKAKRAGGSQIRMQKWTPVIVELRAKDFTFREIWLWLRQEGETVHEDARSFEAGASRIYNAYLRGRRISEGRAGA